MYNHTSSLYTGWNTTKDWPTLPLIRWTDIRVVWTVTSSQTKYPWDFMLIADGTQKIRQSANIGNLDKTFTKWLTTTFNIRLDTNVWGYSQTMTYNLNFYRLNPVLEKNWDSLIPNNIYDIWKVWVWVLFWRTKKWDYFVWREVTEIETWNITLWNAVWYIVIWKYAIPYYNIVKHS